MSIEYTQLKNHPDLEYFTDQDILVPEEYREKIRPLSKNSAEIFWKNNISSHNKHTMLLNEKDWFNELNLKEIAHWQEDWNSNNYSRITNVLRNHVSWEEDTIVYFCWNNFNIMETTWGVFTKYWINFLFDDEAPILISKEKNELFTFGPSDNIYFGCKG